MHNLQVIPRERLSFVKQHGLGLSPACLAALSSVSNAPAEDTKLTFTGIVRLIPDLSTRCKIPWEKQQEMTLVDMCIEPGKPWEYCPREIFRKVVKILKDEFDLVVNVGFKIEFYLLKSVIRNGKEEWFPIDKTSYCSTQAFEVASSIFEDIITYLETMNITVEQVHAETGKGQYEVVLGYTEASTAIISLIYAREVIKSVARQHGMMATFVPKYAEDEDGSGSHVHISLSRNGANVFMASGDSKYGMSKIGESFMAGVFNHLPAILAFTATHPLSYERMLPKTRNAAYVCWGKENTEAPLRTASPPGIADGLVNHFEIKAFDACANPYLSLAAIILSGVDGLRKDLSLPKPVEGDSDVAGEKPRSVPDSLVALEEDTLFSEVMSENLLIAIKGIRKMEVKNYCEPERDYSQPEMDAFKDPLKDFIFKF
ncbi:type-1 glutamine synthetase 1-like [Capsicum galapagoense]